MNQIETAVKYCQNRDLENLMTIVPKTVDPNALIFLWENNGMIIKQGSLLEIAAYCGALDCVRYLLDVKAEVDKRDEYERTPLYMASMSGYLGIIQLLVEQGADVHARDNHGWSPLHRAVLWDHIQVVQFLINKGADVNAADLDGFTPLHLAAKWDHFESAEYLIKAGANVNATTNRFEPSFTVRTPLELAFLNRRTKVARVLRKHGAEALPEFVKKLSSEEKKVFQTFGC